MTKEGALLVTVALALVLLGVIAWAWLRRTRRDAALHAPFGEAPAGAPVLAAHDVLYVATTRHGEPLERLAIRGLGFRSRATLSISAAGVAVDLTGQPRLFIPNSRITDVAQATVTIDRVVERDGLVRLSWSIDENTVVDSYFRPQNASARAVADAITSLTSTSDSSPTSTGTDA